MQQVTASPSQQKLPMQPSAPRASRRKSNLGRAPPTPPFRSLRPHRYTPPECLLRDIAGGGLATYNISFIVVHTQYKKLQIAKSTRVTKTSKRRGKGGGGGSLAVLPGGQGVPALPSASGDGAHEYGRRKPEETIGRKHPCYPSPPRVVLCQRSRYKTQDTLFLE